MNSNSNKLNIKVKRLPIRIIDDGEVGLVPIKVTVNNYSITSSKSLTRKFEILHKPQKSCWSLAIARNNNIRDRKLEVYLGSDNNDRDIEAKFNIVFLDKDDEESIVHQRTVEFNFNSDNAYCGINFDLNRLEQQCVKDGSFNFLIEFHVPVENLGYTSEVKVKPSVVKFLLQSMEFSDLTLVVRGKLINAHKLVLAGASPYFQTNLLANKNLHQLELDKYEFEVINDVINFIYGRKLENLKSFVRNIYEAANEFQMEHLCKICTYYMSEHIYRENLIETVSIALRYNLSDLLDSTVKFSVKHLGQLSKDKDLIKFLSKCTEFTKWLIKILTRNLPDFERAADMDPTFLTTARTTVNRDYEKMFDGEKHTDITFQTPDGKIKAHKSIITARSPVFNAMFEHCLSESSSNVIKIDDMDKTTLKSLLKFIYCEKVDKMDHLTPSLMMAAEKYDMKELKIRCACHLRATLSPQNAVSCLVAADFIDEKILKKDSIHFIGKFFNETIETPEWDEMVTNKPSLLFQMFYLWRSKKK